MHKYGCRVLLYRFYRVGNRCPGTNPHCHFHYPVNPNNLTVGNSHYTADNNNLTAGISHYTVGKNNLTVNDSHYTAN